MIRFFPTSRDWAPNIFPQLGPNGVLAFPPGTQKGKTIFIFGLGGFFLGNFGRGENLIPKFPETQDTSCELLLGSFWPFFLAIPFSFENGLENLG